MNCNRTSTLGVSCLVVPGFLVSATLLVLASLGCGGRSSVADPKTNPKVDPQPNINPTSKSAAPPPSQSKLGDSFTNSIGMELLYIPPGKFTMGSPADEKGHRDDEGPGDVVLTQGFWLGKYEVTQGEFTKVMGTAPWQGQNYVREGSNIAASYISHDDATEFCRKLTQSERMSGRLEATQAYVLPSEAQWEYACRGGKPTAYSFGPTDARLGDYAWFKENTSDAGEHFAHPVGLKLPNPFGLHDMHGNVWEWCRDEYRKELPGGINPEVTGNGKVRVMRGGCWGYYWRLCRSANRYRDASDSWFSWNGFRLSRTP